MRPLLRTVGLSAGIGLLGFCAAVQAQMLPATNAPAMPGLTQVGVAAAVHGRVEITTPGAIGRLIQSGQPVYLGDAVTTDAVGTLQIMLLDETIFTIGPNSSMVIDEFVYDPSNDAGKITAHITQGVFRFVTGKIAKKDPDKMKVQLPAGTIGIRGTMVAGRVEGQRSSVVLLGPGPANSAGQHAGSIVVSNQVGSETRSVSVVRPGFGTTINGPGQPPAPPIHIPQPELDALTGALGQPPQSAGPPAGPDGTPGTGDPQAPGSAPNQPQQGPQQGAPQGPGGPMMGPPGGFGPGMLPPIGPPGTGLFNPPIGLPPLPPPLPNTTQQTQQVLDGLAKFDQLRSIPNGIFHYTVNHPIRFHQTSPVDRLGLLEAKIDIDFGNRTVGGGNSSVHVKTIGTSSIDASIGFPAKSFATGTQDAVFAHTASFLTATVRLNNAGGSIAQNAQVEVDFHDNTLMGAGTSDNVPRSSGASP